MPWIISLAREVAKVPGVARTPGYVAAAIQETYWGRLADRGEEVNRGGGIVEKVFTMHQDQAVTCGIARYLAGESNIRNHWTSFPQDDIAEVIGRLPGTVIDAASRIVHEVWERGLEEHTGERSS